MTGGRITSFAVGVMLIAVPVWIVYSAEPGAVVTTDKSVVCNVGYSRHRREAATYAGLQPRHGYQRDHITPICLGGADTEQNVAYEPLAEAHKKDRLEHFACRAVCNGEMSLPDAQAMFLGGGWKASYRAVFGEEP